MKVLLTGGGTGGHITPLLAVAHKLKQVHPDVEVTYVGERGGKFLHIVEGSKDFDCLRLIRAGKFRRYHGETFLKRLLNVRTNLLNVRDLFYSIIGCSQAIWLLIRHRPDCIFIKGGFVGVPVGLAAALLRVPFVTHDSDTVPGLANRIVGRWAKLHATAMPASFYPYPEDKVRHVGIPLSDKFQQVTAEAQLRLRRELHVPTDAEVLFVTGGSQGAQRMNHVLVPALETLLSAHPQLYVFHQTGKTEQQLYVGADKERVKTFEFLPDLYRYSAIADIVIARASATTVAEFAVQGRACILIPAPHLSGGHQLKNARHLEKAGAVISLDENELASDPQLLVQTIDALLQDSVAKQRLIDNLQKTSRIDAAQKIADLLVELGA